MIKNLSEIATDYYWQYNEWWWTTPYALITEYYHCIIQIDMERPINLSSYGNNTLSNVCCIPLSRFDNAEELVALLCNIQQQVKITCISITNVKVYNKLMSMVYKSPRSLFNEEIEEHWITMLA